MHTECRPTEVGCAVVGAPDSGVKHGPRATALRGEFAALARGTLPQGVSLSGMRERGFLRAFGIGGAVGSGCPLGSGNLVEGPPACHSPSGVWLGAALPGSRQGFRVTRTGLWRRGQAGLLTRTQGNGDKHCLVGGKSRSGSRQSGPADVRESGLFWEAV